tara:strand:- start:332 stop:931 length:600 start_codon:yes stop_codon:yes gene_type:complete
MIIIFDPEDEPNPSNLEIQKSPDNDEVLDSLLEAEGLAADDLRELAMFKTLLQELDRNEPADSHKPASFPPILREEVLPVDPDEQFLDAVYLEAEEQSIDILARDIQRIRVRQEVNKIREGETTALRNMLTEFFDSFVVLGYDVNGQRYFMQHTPEQGHVDALQKYAEQVAGSALLYHNKEAPEESHGDHDDIEDDDFE